jgi:hypothetical protein
MTDSRKKCFLRPCRLCNKNFRPSSPSNKTCDSCVKEIRKEATKKISHRYGSPYYKKVIKELDDENH